jgi:hypothetical protein
MQDRRGSGRIPRQQGPAGGAFPALLRPPQRALPAMRARADGSDARQPGWRRTRAGGSPRDLRKESPGSSPRRWAGSSSATRWAARWASRRCSSNGPTGTFELRRGFALEPGDKVLMVEDVVTTGLSLARGDQGDRGGGRRSDRGGGAGRPLRRDGRSGRAVLPADRAQLPDLCARRAAARTRRHARDQAGQPAP